VAVPYRYYSEYTQAVRRRSRLEVSAPDRSRSRTRHLYENAERRSAADTEVFRRHLSRRLPPSTADMAGQFYRIIWEETVVALPVGTTAATHHPPSQGLGAARSGSGQGLQDGLDTYTHIICWREKLWIATGLASDRAIRVAEPKRNIDIESHTVDVSIRFSSADQRTNTGTTTRYFCATAR
jgi:hypothetical protein